ncbi:MAG: transglutaminase domain-containing protein [Candidatus Yanofskybacteria bacterium]|nr:transglutaminase domain-containing protein [Candidatus Yanofskybacteria bacterium]
MNNNTLKHFLEFSTYTYPGLYQEKLKKELPDNIREIGLLVRKGLVHRSTMEMGNVGTNTDMRFGDMTQMPWWRQPEDDYLVTASAMLAELYRRDPRGFVQDRAPENKLVLTCRFTAVLMASILKSKGIPTRCRAVHHYAPYFDDSLGKVSADHWINQYWNKDENRWVTIDVDGSLSVIDKQYDPYDMPVSSYDFPADAWLAIKNKEVDPNYFYNGDGTRGAIVVLWSLIYDFHSLMNDEILYTHIPSFGQPERFQNLNEEEKSKIDNLAHLMQKPDENFDELKKIWESDKDFRLLRGGLL